MCIKTHLDIYNFKYEVGKATYCLHHCQVITPAHRLLATAGRGPNCSFLYGACVQMRACRYNCVAVNPGTHLSKLTMTWLVKMHEVASQFWRTCLLISPYFTTVARLTLLSRCKSWIQCTCHTSHLNAVGTTVEHFSNYATVAIHQIAQHSSARMVPTQVCNRWITGA